MISRAESWSRYSEGHRCRWKRLLGNYFQNKGIQSVTPSLDLMVGSTLHKCLETIVKAPDPIEPPYVTQLLAPIIEDHRKAVTRMVPSDRPSENGEESACLVEALSHAWARITYPWLIDTFDILSTEEMVRFDVKDPKGGGPVVFRAKPDLTCRNRKTGVISVHDYKSTSYWDDDSSEQWHFNMQMYLTAYLVELNLKEPEKVAEYYIHPLVKGNKKYPSPIVKPWIAPAVTPTGKPTFSTRWRKGFDRDFVFKHKPTAEFIWDLPANQLTKFVPVAGPFGTDEEMARDFIEGGITENRWWVDNLRGMDWDKWALPVTQVQLVSKFPRSYQCWDFKRLCEFHPLCFRRKGWEDPSKIGFTQRSYR